MIKSKWVVALAAAALAIGVGVTAHAQDASHDPVCDTHNQKPVRVKSKTQPIPGTVKRAVLCYYSTPLDTNVTTVQSHLISKPAAFAKLLNASKPGSYVQCMMYFPYHFAIVFYLTDGHRVYVNPVNCGPLLSNASSSAFQMTEAARARFGQLTAEYLPASGPK